MKDNPVVARLRLTDLIEDRSAGGMKTLPRTRSTKAELRQAFERVRERSRGVEDQILHEEGGCVPAAELARISNCSTSTIRRRRKAGELIAVRRGKVDGYPVWQVWQGEFLVGIREAVQILRRKDTFPFGMVLFFTTPAEALDQRRPVDLLRVGRVEEVTLHARRYGVIGS